MKAAQGVGQRLIGTAPDATQARPPMLADRPLPAQGFQQPRRLAWEAAAAPSNAMLGISA